MARIRSTHPNQWTDEAFVSVSAHARLLALGLRNEADDYGVFKWKPLTLKMRILPADNIDAGALLGELENADIVRKFQIDGETYGAIRNFCRYQRPKKPQHYHPFPDDVREYVGTSSKPVPNQSPTKAEKSPQMESETYTETEKDAPSAPAAKAERATRLALDALPDEWRELCRRERPGLNADTSWLKFKNYWLAKGGKDGRKLDWKRTWHNWILTERVQNGHDPPIATVGPPPGFREAKSTGEYVDYMREKTGDPKLTLGDYRLSKWQYVPVSWQPNVVKLRESA